jgi:hypothetical protein
MKVKFKLERKAYVTLINYAARIEKHKIICLNTIDEINLREMYIDARNKHERWKLDKNYAIKKYTLNLDINQYATLKKIFTELNQWQKPGYESFVFDLIQETAEKQIMHYNFINQQLIMF